MVSSKVPGWLELTWPSSVYPTSTAKLRLNCQPLKNLYTVPFFLQVGSKSHWYFFASSWPAPTPT